ncbi:hypothetical protein CA598_01945 [Paenibacillus sp. VTT E-133291]|jgi:hypothetical protein|nr:hypothetical protein CA598_01945 [Paenibacillus sp. VTT E-133291]
MDYTSPDTQFTFDVNTNTLFKKDANNFINMLSIKQLNTLENISLLDIFLSKSNVVEPHYHQNAAELVYCICGSAVVSILNPFTNELLHFPICPGQVANVPQGWWHYEVATVDNTHLLAIFDAPIPEVILGSDILSKTPANVLAHTYCLNEALVKEALAPIKPGTFIGPPADCCEEDKVKGVSNMAPNMAPNMKPNMAPSMNMHANMKPNMQPNMHPNMQPYAQMQAQPIPIASQMPQATQAFTYQPYPMQGYYTQGYEQHYRQQPYVQQQPNYQYSNNQE